jgi:hypothetical protein
MTTQRHIRAVPNCTCEPSANLHAPDCAIALAGLDNSPALTAEQVETLAAAVLAFTDRYDRPQGKRQRLTAEKKETIRLAVELAESLLGTEHRNGTW